MKVLILNGNSEKTSFSRSICVAYKDEAEKAGHQVHVMNVGDMKFDPILWEGYHTVQQLEPDLAEFQKQILSAKHIVIVYPTWWAGLPALLKGLFDRSFHPGFAFNYREKPPFWDKLLKGRSAHIITTMDAPKWWYWFMERSAGTNMLKHGILNYCGIAPVKVTIIGNMRSKSPETLSQDMKMIRKIASGL